MPWRLHVLGVEAHRAHRAQRAIFERHRAAAMHKNRPKDPWTPIDDPRGARPAPTRSGADPDAIRTCAGTRHCNSRCRAPRRRNKERPGRCRARRRKGRRLGLWTAACTLLQQLELGDARMQLRGLGALARELGEATLLLARSSGAQRCRGRRARRGPRRVCAQRPSGVAAQRTRPLEPRHGAKGGIAPRVRYHERGLGA